MCFIGWVGFWLCALLDELILNLMCFIGWIDFQLIALLAGLTFSYVLY